MIPGLRVGHVTDAVGLTGCTVILSDAPAVGGVEIRGWAAGVHGLEFLDPRHLVPTLDGVVLAGGSAFGLEAIWGVMRYLEERGVGFPTSQTVVPHVAGAILYDLGVGDPTARPDRAMGHRAARRRAPGARRRGQCGRGHRRHRGQAPRHRARDQGRARLRGRWSATACTCGALMAVNAVGDVRDPETGRLIAGARDAADGRRLIDTGAALAAGAPAAARSGPSTPPSAWWRRRRRSTRWAAARVARLAMDGFARALSPPHLATDGDALFCLSVGTARADVDALGRAAADLVARAIARAVRAATAAGGLPAARDLE